MWILYSNPAWWCYYPGFIGHYVFFVSGIILLIAYHLKFHPKGWREPDDDGPDDRSLETE